MQRAKLRSGEAHFRAIIDSTPDAFIAVDLNGTAVAFNRVAEAFFDIPASAVLGRPIAASCLPDALRQCFAVSLHKIRAGDPIAGGSLEIEGRRASGQGFAAEASFFAAKAGKEAVLAARIHDITARRQTEQRLNRILRTMKGGNQALVRARSEDELFQAICRVIVETGGFRMAWIGQIEHDDEKSIRPLAYAGHEAGYLGVVKISWGDNPEGRGPSGTSIRTGTPQFNNDITGNPVMGPWREPALERCYLSSISLPLKDKTGVFGALTIYASETHAFGEEEVALLVELAGDVSYGVTALRTRRDRDEMARLINERKKAEAALTASEERFRGIYEHAATGISILNLQGQFQFCNPAYSTMVGYTEEELHELNFQDLVHPSDLDTNMAFNRRLLALEIPSFEIVNRFVRKDGKPIWVHKHVSVLRDAAGAPASLIALVTDITERKLHEERIDLLMHEVNHRAKNMLAVVLAVARQTVASQPQDFIARFEQRIKAMAASQDLLVKNEWRGVDIEDLVRSQFAHFHDLMGTRIELHGPSLFISASAAQTLGMALHELATNAGKYGALSDSGGRLQVEWGLESAEGGEETFSIGWRELGGPPVTAPDRRGFGSTVISRMAKEGLDANVHLDFAPPGLTWRLECPAKEVTQHGR
ncbi:MAG: PAS domain S-box protein [Rhodomicrobium sp.]